MFNSGASQQRFRTRRDPNKPVHVYLIRHAESDNNVAEYNAFAKHAPDMRAAHEMYARTKVDDPNLTNLGFKQAKACGEALAAELQRKGFRGKHIRMVASPMKRCLQTSIEIHKACNVTTHIDVHGQLYEMKCTGKKYKGTTFNELMKGQFGGYVRVCEHVTRDGWKLDHLGDSDETESYMQGYDRVRDEVVPFLQQGLRRKLQMEPHLEVFIVVVHAELLSAIMRHFLGQPATNTCMFNFLNTSWTHYELTAKIPTPLFHEVAVYRHLVENKLQNPATLSPLMRQGVMLWRAGCCAKIAARDGKAPAEKPARAPTEKTADDSKRNERDEFVAPKPRKVKVGRGMPTPGQDLAGGQLASIQVQRRWSQGQPPEASPRLPTTATRQVLTLDSSYSASDVSGLGYMKSRKGDSQALSSTSSTSSRGSSFRLRMKREQRNFYSSPPPSQSMASRSEGHVRSQKLLYGSSYDE